MLSRKNKDTRTIKEGVVGKYVKKDKPPEIPSKYLVHNLGFQIIEVLNFISTFYKKEKVYIFICNVKY